jgi:hypothetical protein
MVTGSDFGNQARGNISDVVGAIKIETMQRRRRSEAALSR